jgi:small subunit ribosomal protein S21
MRFLNSWSAAEFVLFPFLGFIGGRIICVSAKARIARHFCSLTIAPEKLCSASVLIYLRAAARADLSRPRKEVSALTEIKLKKGEPVDRALRRLKKKVDREGTLKIVRSHRTFEKPSERRRRKEKVARFSAMLAARYADL